MSYKPFFLLTNNLQTEHKEYIIIQAPYKTHIFFRLIQTSFS